MSEGFKTAGSIGEEELPEEHVSQQVTSRRVFVSKIARRMGGAAVAASSIGLVSTPESGLAWSYNASSYVTPVAFRCYPVTQWYGSGSHIYGENARAIDIGCPVGTPVYAPKDGTISFEGWEGDGGIVCRINHADGLQTVLAHLSRTVVDTGWWVRGSYTLIGYTGATGKVSGPHLHWALKIRGTSQGIDMGGIRGVSRWNICP